MVHNHMIRIPFLVYRMSSEKLNNKQQFQFPPLPPPQMQFMQPKNDSRCYKLQGVVWQRLLHPISSSLWSEHPCSSWQMRWEKNLQTEYSPHCNRFSLLCQNRLQCFASLLESCVFLLPPSFILRLPLLFFSPLLQYGTLHFIVSLCRAALP